jgi:hypothetical protein
MRWVQVMTAAAGLASASAVRAADPPPASGCHTPARAGHPQHIAWYAVPGLSPKETGGYVGGGCLFRGTVRGPADGTWGWDYVGKGKHPGRIFLSWCGCARQPRPGPYKTDGPEVPDVFAVKPIKRALEKSREHE